MKYKLIFIPELKDEIIADLEIAKKETEDVEGAMRKGIKGRIASWTLGRLGIPKFLFIDYEVLSDTEIEVSVHTSVDSLPSALPVASGQIEKMYKDLMRKRIERLNEDYGKLPNGEPKVKMEVIE